MPSNSHLALLPHCSACEDIILQQECTVSIVDKASHRTLTRPFQFPPLGPRRLEVSGFMLCRIPGCKRCVLAPESVAVHSQCFKTFTKEYGMPLPQVLDYLWTIACYRRPWPHTPDLGLTSCRPFSQSWLARIARDSELAGLRSIPEELLDIIKQFSPHAYLWRFGSILALTPRPISAQLPLMLALDTIENWRRGDCEVAGVGDKGPIIRIIMDSHGIQAVKRLPELPKVKTESSKRHLYIVENLASLAGVQACIQDGLLRLRLPLNIECLPIWDTPSPPRLAECSFQPRLQRRWQRFKTISLESVRGITFFYSMGLIHGVFAHTLTAPCAFPLYQRFPETLQQHTVWVYLPIAREDRIIGFGTKQADNGLCIMVRTRLSGDFTIGPQSPGGRLDRWLCSNGHIVLAYSVPSDCQRFPVSLGTYSPSKSEETQNAEIREEYQYSLGHITYFSSAPLKKISCACIFEDGEKDICHGILFEYEGGGSRAVGQCRVGVDRERKCVRPSIVCFRTIWSTDKRGRHPRGTQVDLAQTQSHHSLEDHSQEEWQCRDLSDVHTLQFWFAAERSMLFVIPRNEKEASG